MDAMVEACPPRSLDEVCQRTNCNVPEDSSHFGA